MKVCSPYINTAGVICSYTQFEVAACMGPCFMAYARLKNADFRGAIGDQTARAQL